MKITVNGKEYTDGPNQPLENKPRLKWSDIGRLAGIPHGKFTNNSTVRINVPGEEKPREHKHGFSLILIDGMAITARP